MNRISRIGRFAQTIRNSRFIGVCGPGEDEAAARAFIDANAENGCRHVCWAFRCGPVVRFDDAGEPGGTAGRPILAAMDAFELDASVIVVSRFFGGIKLGTGGLARAYGSTATGAIENARGNAGVEPIIETVTLVCNVPFASAGDLHLLAERHNAEKRREEWSGNGLQLELEITRELAETFIDELSAITRGESSVKRLFTEPCG